MAESKDSHIVEIPVSEEHENHRKTITITDPISAIQHHPLMEISRSPGHLLLLKLWQREEDLFARRIAIKETRIDAIRREIFQLCCFFFLFHGFFFTILFTSSVLREEHKCERWWIPSILSLTSSIAILFFIQIKHFRYWKVSKQLKRERNDSRALTRCIQELRMKGASFDLSKEPQIAKRLKSSSVEIKWRPISWCKENLVTVCLLLFAGLAFPAPKLILCVF
ncbi:hypothetical protein Nepgr_007720 [Nepenthes gracilis]|uniref:Transmembrane protein n=1 Tax=Nepenthes gracilis TaxID=150966 RepID=A0AAD3XIQ3_NEPGR|nr:hypothetical protein Nepgr_007720 [Nepenthes gracilis]